MRNLKLLLCGVLILSFSTSAFSQLTRQGEETARTIKPGKGQVFSEKFVEIDKFHFVQFGVYPIDTPISKIFAPKEIDNVWLISHGETVIKNYSGKKGALYITKPFSSEEEAQKAVNEYRKKGIRCWYNATLSSSTFSIVACTENISEW